MGLCLPITLEPPELGSRTHSLLPSDAKGLLSRCARDLTMVCLPGLLFAFLCSESSGMFWALRERNWVGRC